MAHWNKQLETQLQQLLTHKQTWETETKPALKQQLESCIGGTLDNQKLENMVANATKIINILTPYKS